MTTSAERFWVGRSARTEARRRIVQAANRHILDGARRRGHYYPARLLSMRHIQEAVCVLRRSGAMKPDRLAKLLDEAGYRP